MICVDFKDISYLPFGTPPFQTLITVAVAYQYCQCSALVPPPCTTVDKLPSDEIILFVSLGCNSSLLSVQFLKTVVPCILFRFLVGEAGRGAPVSGTPEWPCA